MWTIDHLDLDSAKKGGNLAAKDFDSADPSFMRMYLQSCPKLARGSGSMKASRESQGATILSRGKSRIVPAETTDSMR